MINKKFDLRLWYRYREQAKVFGDKIQAYKDSNKFDSQTKKYRNAVESIIKELSCVLKDSDIYLNQCGFPRA